MEVKGVIPGAVPSKSNLYKIIKINGHASLGKSDKLTSYENVFYLSVGKYRGEMISELFEFYVDVYYPSNRSDLDNSLKVVLDCLQTCKVIKNDNKCTKIVARKFIDKTNPRIEFNIKTAI